MRELEKILEEIDRATDEYGMVDYINDEPVISKNRAKDIIRQHLSHENTLENTRSSRDNKCVECSRRKCYMKGYEDAVKEEPGVTKEFLKQCKEVVKKYEKIYSDWIPVEKLGLPKSNEHGCRYWVTIQDTNGFRHTIKAQWDWFDNYFIHQNGKKILQNVIAYKYYSEPEPYFPERSMDKRTKLDVV